MTSLKKSSIIIATIGIFFFWSTQFTYAAIVSPVEQITEQSYIVKQVILLKLDIRSSFKNGDKYIDQINTALNNIDDVDKLKRLNTKISKYQSSDINTKILYLIDYIKYKNRLKLYNLWIRWGETINGISVPPEPGEQKSTATLSGVDSNNNGVRDDIERLIAEKYGEHEETYLAGIVQAQAIDRVYSSESDDAIEQLNLVIRCTSKHQYSMMSTIEKEYANTPERWDKFYGSLRGTIISIRRNGDECKWVY